MDPQNQEYHEAAQAKANEIRQKFYATLTEHEKAQFDAVEKACNLLVDAGVLFYLFPMLPNASGRPEDAQYNSLWQYNSLDQFICYDAAGKLTRNDQLLLDCANGSLCKCVLASFLKINELTEENTKLLLNVLNWALNINLDIPKTALVKKAE